MEYETLFNIKIFPNMRVRLIRMTHSRLDKVRFGTILEQTYREMKSFCHTINGGRIYRIGFHLPFVKYNNTFFLELKVI